MELLEAQRAALMRFPLDNAPVNFALEPRVNDVVALVEAGLAEGRLEMRARAGNGWTGRLTEAGVARGGRWPKPARPMRGCCPRRSKSCMGGNWPNAGSTMPARSWTTAVPWTCWTTTAARRGWKPR